MAGVVMDYQIGAGLLLLTLILLALMPPRAWGAMRRP